MNRRDFLSQTAATTATLAIGGTTVLTTAPAEIPDLPWITLDFTANTTQPLPLKMVALPDKIEKWMAAMEKAAPT